VPEQQLQADGPPKDAMLVAAEILISNEGDSAVVLQNWALRYEHIGQTFENRTPNKPVVVSPAGKALASLIFLLSERPATQGQSFVASLGVTDDRGELHWAEGVRFRPIGPPHHSSLVEPLPSSPRVVNDADGVCSEPEHGADPRRVFVVHGRNMDARDAMFAFLRAINLDPIEWDQAVALTSEGSPYIGSVLGQAVPHARAVVVCLTGDDVARLRHDFQESHDPPYEKDLTPQARPNVLFEAGMAFAQNPKGTVLVAFEYTRPFSDILGRHVLPMSNSSRHRQALASRLKIAGCDVRTDQKADWLSAGDFDRAIKPLAEPPNDIKGRLAQEEVSKLDAIWSLKKEIREIRRRWPQLEALKYPLNRKLWSPQVGESVSVEIDKMIQWHDRFIEYARNDLGHYPVSVDFDGLMKRLDLDERIALGLSV